MAPTSTDRPVRHFAEVLSRKASTGGREYIADCSCKQVFTGRATRRMAVEDMRDHQAAVANVAPGERCRNVARHRTPPTERCALCADQLAFTFDEIGDLP